MTKLTDADLLEKIEVILPKLDGIKSPLQLAMADCLIRLRFLLKQQDKPISTGLVKPKKRERAAYYRAYRLRVKARRAC